MMWNVIDTTNEASMSLPLETSDWQWPIYFSWMPATPPTRLSPVSITRRPGTGVDQTSKEAQSFINLWSFLKNQIDENPARQDGRKILLKISWLRPFKPRLIRVFAQFCNQYYEKLKMTNDNWKTFCLIITTVLQYFIIENNCRGVSFD